MLPAIPTPEPRLPAGGENEHGEYAQAVVCRLPWWRVGAAPSLGDLASVQRNITRIHDSGAVSRLSRERQRVQTAIQQATQWLLFSGIQEHDHDSPMHGGVRAWFDTERRSFAFYYTEITGYALTSLLFLNYLHPDEQYVDHATNAAHWLITQARDPASGALRCRFGGGAATTHACSFDNGVCLNGLVNLYRLTGEQRYLDAATDVGAWLTGAMQASDGSLMSKFDLSAATPHNPGGKWSLISGSYLVKAAIGLANLADLTGDERLTASVRALCDWGLTQQEPDGRFRTSPPNGDTYLHPHCYGAEGLIVAGVALGEPRWIEAAARAVSWIAQAQLPTGGFPAYFEYGRSVAVESPEMTAQALRLWLLLPPDLRPSLDVAAAVHRIEESQFLAPSQEAHGAFTAGPAWFYHEAEDHSGKHANAWISMIALQTLILAAGICPEFPVFYLV